jgi:hypothetical protein
MANVEALLERLDGSGSQKEYEAVGELRGIVGDDLPRYLLAKYRTSKRWQQRAACVFRALAYARESEDAVNLGREAIRDRSKVVRYRAGMLLSYAQRPDVIPELRQLLKEKGHAPDLEDVRAALDALDNRNPNYYVDRDHSGMVTMTVEKWKD